MLSHHSPLNTPHTSVCSSLCCSLACSVLPYLSNFQSLFQLLYHFIHFFMALLNANCFHHIFFSSLVAWTYSLLLQQPAERFPHNNEIMFDDWITPIAYMDDANNSHCPLEYMAIILDWR